MTQFAQPTLASSADYAEALLSARRAKTVLTILILLVLLTELGLFFVLRFYKPLPWGDTAAGAYSREVTQYFIGLLDFAGMILPFLLVAVICLILNVQLVGRLLGVGRLTTALFWAVLLAALLFPWQAVLNNPAINYNKSADEIGLKIPGVVYTWAEISNPELGATFGMPQVKSDAQGTGDTTVTASPADAPKPVDQSEIGYLVLKWARYVGFPVLSILILTIIHLKTHRGLRQSLGEDQIIPETTTIPAA